VGEMVAACSLMFPAFFGGEAGVSGNRQSGGAMLGVSYGPQIQVYYLIAAWLVLCTAGIYLLARTPLGRMANAVRDNPERAQFVGYDPRRVRFFMVALSGFFAGVAGGLSAINYEIVTVETLSASTSGLVLLATYLGGIGFFAGPIAGAIVVTLMQMGLSSVTHAWPFYFGALFVATVLFVPGGLASLWVLHVRLWRSRLLGAALAVYARMAVPALVLFGVVVFMVELAYRGADDTPVPLSVAGVDVDSTSTGNWITSVVILVAAIALVRWAWSRVSPRWADIEAALQGSRK
jgi:branched-chain amino acid transport system permease protein